MQVRNHRLCDDAGTPVPYVPSPNHGGQLAARYLVIHYTADGSAAGAIAALTNPAHKASAHLVISRTGEITQLVPFNAVAWHAGASQWEGLTGLNTHSIGIELDNVGYLHSSGGTWKSWFNGAVPNDQVLEARHKNGGAMPAWQTYPEAQLRAAIDAGRAIAAAYQIADVVGHDDIAPGRKWDPGPAFPMDSFRGAVIGRDQTAPEEFEAVTGVNLRAGPAATFEKIKPAALPQGTRMFQRAREGAWREVTVLTAARALDATGWVHGDYVKRV